MNRYRIILLISALVILQLIGFTIEGSMINLLESFWYTSGLLLLVLLSLVGQPFFSRDSDIFVNSITALLALLLLPLKGQGLIYYALLIYILYLLLSSIILMIKRSKSLKEEGIYVQFLSRFNRIIGKPDIIFSVFFLWGAVTQYTLNSWEFNLLLLAWTIFMLLNNSTLSKEIQTIIKSILYKQELKKAEGIGRIFGIHSQNIFLIKVENKVKYVETYDFVEMKYSANNKVYKGLIYEKIYLNEEQWIKVITNTEIENLFENGNRIKKPINDVVYLIDTPQNTDVIHRFIGLVAEESEINKVRFLYNPMVSITEGNIVETTINRKKVTYQIVEGITKKEKLLNNNESGFIIGEAIQLGTWNEVTNQFDKYGWVPTINNPLYLAESVNHPGLEPGELIIGELPDIKYPVILNKELAVTHHMAVIGVTGTGKSVFSRNLIREHLKEENMKVICVDFTEEYKAMFDDLNPSNAISDVDAKEIHHLINIIEQEESKFLNQRVENLLGNSKKTVYEKMKNSIDSFLKGDTNITIFELPEVQNTSGVMYYTMAFIRTLFDIAKKEGSYGKKICLVLEEAHTIIPEWNFAGTNDKNSQAVLNSIAQIALQGRKYDIGLLVIAQRTANVSKTILTQCNSIVSFQQFDNTSIEFLKNYFGSEMASSLTNLKFRQAIATGKAFKSSVPMIFNVPDITE